MTDRPDFLLRRIGATPTTGRSPAFTYCSPKTISHNRPGSTRMGELLAATLGYALDRLEPLLELAEGTA